MQPTSHQAPVSAPHEALTLGDLVGLCWRRRWPALLAAVLVAATVALALLRMTPLFEAESSLAVDRGRKAVEFQADPDAGRIEYSLLNTQRDLLQGNVVLKQALETSGALRREPYAASEDPAAALRKRLKITTSRDSWVIKVAVRDEQADRAQALLQKVLDAFLAQQQSLKAAKAQGALTFLSDQVAGARERLEQARAAEQEFRTRQNILSTDPNQNQVTQRLQQLTSQLTELDQRAAAAGATSQQVQAAMAEADAERRLQALLRIPDINRHPVVVEQQKLLYELEDKRTLLAQKYLAAHPRMAEIEEQIRAKRGHLADATALARSAIEAQVQELTLERKDLMARLATAETELNAYRANLVRLQALSEERTTREKLAEQLLTRLGQEEVASRLDTSQVVVVDPPRVGPRPVNVKPTLFAAAALAAGVVAALLAALAAEALDRRVRGAGSAAEISRLPLVGQIPHIANLTALGKGGDPEQPPLLAEAYRALRASLLLSRRGGAGSQVLVITSTGPGEGKSTVAVRLALALAGTGQKVLLVDADMRRPTGHHQVGMTCERGLSFLLVGEEGISPTPTSWANLDFLGVGVRPPNPAELLHGSRLGELIAAWRKAYAVVVIDTPPMGLVSDCVPVCEHADGVLLVVRDRQTLRGALRRVVERLEPLRAKLAGVILNAERKGGEHYGYGYGYGYGYKYGYQYAYSSAGQEKKPDAPASSEAPKA